MGTPAFAARIVDIVSHWPHGELIALYTQPDRPAKRGHKTQASAVKEWALARSIPIFQPATLKGPDELERMRALAPDFLLVAAYGLLSPQAILDVPTFPPLNVHGSLLPKYRGAAPVQRSIMECYGDGATTGVSIMQMVAALDAGPVFLQKPILIENKTADELFVYMADVGGALLCETLDAFRRGVAHGTPQDESQASYAAKLEKSDGIVRWNEPFAAVHAQIRGVTSSPGAHTNLSIANATIPITLLPGAQGSACAPNPPGTILLDPQGLHIACRDTWYTLDQVKPQGKGFMTAKAFCNGYLRAVPHGVCGSAT